MSDTLGESAREETLLLFEDLVLDGDGSYIDYFMCKFPKVADDIGVTIDDIWEPITIRKTRDYIADLTRNEVLDTQREQNASPKDHTKKAKHKRTRLRSSKGERSTYR